MNAATLDAYLARIRHQGGREPTLATLRGLVAAHVTAIPFENLDVLTGRGVRLEPGRVDAKLIHGGRGGYCFEHASLMGRALDALGFEVRYLGGRAGLDRTPAPPRTHLLLRLEVDGEPWIVDPGLGGLTPSAPLRLVPGLVQDTLHEPRRLVRVPEGWRHQVWLEDEWADLCEWTGEEMPPVDREVANWYTSTHPDSIFRRGLMVARAGPDGQRISLLGRRLTVRTRGRVERRTLSDDALVEALDALFGLRLPPEVALEGLVD